MKTIIKGLLACEGRLGPWTVMSGSLHSVFDCLDGSLIIDLFVRLTGWLFG